MSDTKSEACDDHLLTQMRFNGAGPTFQAVMRQLADDVPRVVAALTQSGAEIALAVLDELDRALPANWDQLTISQVNAVAHLMEESRCNLAWVPGADLVAKVVAAPPGTRPIALLIDHREVVLADIEKALESLADGPELSFRVQAAREALASFQDGRLIAAQATASATLTGIAHLLTSEERLARVHSALSNVDLERATVLDLRRRAVRRLVGRAMAGANRHVSGPYNRSASLHDVAPGQYTAENAMASLLLVTAALCELREENAVPELAEARRWDMSLSQPTPLSTS